MLGRCSKRLTSFFIRKNSIAEEKREIYDYSFEILISTLLNLLVLIVIGIATARYLETLIFTVVFMAMRGLGGGCHAKTHIGCIVGLLMFYGTFIGLAFVPVNILTYMSIPLHIIAMIISFILAPVGSVNKDIESEYGKKLKFKLIGTNILLSLIYSILMIFEVTRIYAFSIAFTAFSVSILYVVGAIQNKIRIKKDI